MAPASVNHGNGQGASVVHDAIDSLPDRFCCWPLYAVVAVVAPSSPPSLANTRPVDAAGTSGPTVGGGAGADLLREGGGGLVGGVRVVVVGELGSPRGDAACFGGTVPSVF